MMMSPFSRCGVRWSIIWSTVSPALTISITRRGFFKHLRQLLDRVRAHHLRAVGFVRDEIVDLRDGAIEDGHAVAVVVHIQDQVLAHYREADQSDVASFRLHECYCNQKTGVSIGLAATGPAQATYLATQERGRSRGITDLEAGRYHLIQWWTG